MSEEIIFEKTRIWIIGKIFSLKIKLTFFSSKTNVPLGVLVQCDFVLNVTPCPFCYDHKWSFLV